MNPERLRKAPNIAIVGSSSPLGKELKDAIEDSGLPRGRLALFETEAYAGLLQEFAGEIQITQILSPDAFSDIDIAFFACSPEIIDAYAASGAAFPELTIDLTQTRTNGTLFLSGISDPTLLRDTGYFISPHPAAIVLAHVFSSLDETFRIESASVTILQPVSERGAGGADELQEETVGLLNFHPIENKVFEGQIAFNVLSEGVPATRTEERVRGQLAQLMAARIPAPALMVLQTPTFSSHAFSLFVRFDTTTTIDELKRCLAARALISLDGEGKDSPSPVAVVGTEQIHIGRVSLLADAYGLWIVADNLRLAASNALRIAESIMFSPAPQG